MINQSLEHKVIITANTYDWIIATPDSKTNNAICVIIKIVNKDVDRKGPVFAYRVKKCPNVFENHFSNNNGKIINIYIIK